MTTNLYDPTCSTHEHTNRCWWDVTEARWSCAAAASPTPAPFTDAPLADVRDMIVVHTALLREFRLAPAAVERVRAGDAGRAAVVDDHLGFVCELLHHHHTGEDELLWPRLRQRVPATAHALLDEVEAQHGAIESALDAVAIARTAWTAGAAPVERYALATALRRLHRLLTDHLELEERAVLPLAAGALTQAEWDELGAAASAALPKPVLALVFGMFAYEGDPAVLAQMLAHAPAVPRLLLPHLAPRVYARRAAKVHGTRTP